MTRLDEAALAAGLARTPGWAREGRAIARTYRFADFPAAMLFVNGVAALAERVDHHPDITVRYREVTLALWTHTDGGVTARDLELARLIDATFPPPPGG